MDKIIPEPEPVDLSIEVVEQPTDEKSEEPLEYYEADEAYGSFDSDTEFCK